MPGLAETVLEDRVAEHVDFFLRMCTVDHAGVHREARDAFVSAYEVSDSLRSGFEHYRALAHNADLVAEAAREHEIGMAVLAPGADHRWLPR